MMDIRTWELDPAEVRNAVAKLGKLNDRAAKNDLQGRYTWELGSESRVPVYSNGTTIPDDEADRPVSHRVTRELHVNGDAPKLAGWSFLVRLTWDGGVLVTRTTPGFEGRIDDSQIRERECDHCGQARNRNDCYLLENDQGERVQVGSSCVKDFLGHDFRPSFISYGADLDAIEESCGGRYSVDADTLEVLTWAASICSRTGWVSRAKADAEYSTPSGSTLRDCLFGHSKADRDLRKDYQPTAENRTEAAKVLDWAKGVEPGDSEYLANVKRCAQANFIGERNTAILGSAVASYHREVAAKVEREARPVSQWVGQPKDKLELDVTIKGETVIDGYYGTTHLYTLTDPEGNVFKWFASTGQEWETGQQVRIRGTVKDHEEYREVRQTVLTRCKVIKEPQAAKHAEVEPEASAPQRERTETGEGFQYRAAPTEAQIDRDLLRDGVDPSAFRNREAGA